MVTVRDKRSGKREERPGPDEKTGETMAEWSDPAKRGWMVTRGELIGVLSAYDQHKWQRSWWGRLVLFLDHGLFRFGKKQVHDPNPPTKEAT